MGNQILWHTRQVVFLFAMLLYATIFVTTVAVSVQAGFWHHYFLNIKLVTAKPRWNNMQMTPLSQHQRFFCILVISKK